MSVEKNVLSIRALVEAFEEMEIIGNADTQIDGLNLTNRKTQCKKVLSFAVSSQYVQNVNDAQHVKAMVLRREDVDAYKGIMDSRNGCIIVAENPEVTFYMIHEYLYKETDFYEKFDFPAQIGENCNIHPTAFIDDGVIIGNRVTIGAGTVVKRGSIIDDDTTIGCSTVIGTEGFQLIIIPGKEPLHVTHVGKCHIANNVYVGDNTCICNSLFDGETFVAAGAKIDNHVHIGHNIYVGENAVLTAHVVLGGSCRIEAGAWLGMNTTVLNRVVVGEGSKAGMASVITRDVEPYTLVYGSPAKAHGFVK